MRAAEPVEHSLRGFDAAGLDVGQPALNAFDCLNAIKQRLVRLGVLDDEFGLAVDGQDDGVTGLPQTIEQIGRVSLEVTEGSEV